MNTCQHCKSPECCSRPGSGGRVWPCYERELTSLRAELAEAKAELSARTQSQIIDRIVAVCPSAGIASVPSTAVRVICDEHAALRQQLSEFAEHEARLRDALVKAEAGVSAAWHAALEQEDYTAAEYYRLLDGELTAVLSGNTHSKEP